MPEWALVLLVFLICAPVLGWTYVQKLKSDQHWQKCLQRHELEKMRIEREHKERVIEIKNELVISKVEAQLRHRQYTALVNLEMEELTKKNSPAIT